jgi:hypothetical protein
LEKVADRFNAQGELTDDQTRQKIGELWAAFVPWIQKLRQT